jgi:hypothetical protein
MAKKGWLLLQKSVSQISTLSRHRCLIFIRGGKRHIPYTRIILVDRSERSTRNQSVAAQHNHALVHFKSAVHKR